MSIISKLTKSSGLIALALAVQVQAHERFMVPSHTLLSGDKAQAVTVTASISNAIFHPDRPFGDSNTGANVGDLKDLFNMLEHQVIKPNGEVTTDTRWQAFARLSVADVWFKESGTYRIGLVQPEVNMTTFKKIDGTFSRRFGKNPKLPEGVTDVVRRTTSSRIETFISFNAPNLGAVKPTGVGVELGGDTHPNDLFAGETANFQLFYQGKPITQPAKIKVIKAGTRHRNERNEQQLAVAKDGTFNFTPDSAGFYFLAAETMEKVAQPADVDVKHFSLYLTLEVFPE
ncbi:DUF4198 domain-containing protein [Thalassotalea sp. M1531]|uniref:DUF4198 domain-containing protein n=1 Tax=Thalassotalea algicola TaxID=2716224 RepID=A0A7Y0LCS0_9GAMM|nr:DUF4198 domain-containing protein [Thalassotalea algicola]NMP30715.1 DUF4198 domain-containing protein [Thalassotalea algicola]